MSFALAGRVAGSQQWADLVARGLQPLVKRAVAPRPVRNFLDGVWLGAPLHPALTDVPVGAWTAAVVLDGASAVRRDATLATAADRTLEVGTLAALPAAVTGLNDLRDLRGQSRRIATVHALLNVAGLSLTVTSVACRRSGRRNLGRTLSGLGYLVSATAAHLGGELSFGLGIRVNRTLGQSAPLSFVPVLDDDDLEAIELHRVDADGVPVLLARAENGEICALADTCTHMGGPLSEGSRDGDVVTCPWHGSKFDLCTGKVVQGPAVFHQPRLAVRVRNGTIEVGMRGAPATELPEVGNLQSV